MEGKFAKICSYTLLIAILTAGVVAMATNNTLVLAQPCQAQLGPPNVSTPQFYYYGDNFQVSVPVSASCSFYGGQMYATGTAYDTSYNANVGTANTALNPTYGGYGYTGELTFTLPTSSQSHSVLFSVSIYSTQYGYYAGYYGGSLLAQTSATFVVGPSYYQGYPTYPSYSYYPSYPSYPNYPWNGNYYGSNYYNYYPNVGYYYYHYYCRSSRWPWRNYCSHR